MPQTASAEKALRVSQRRAGINEQWRMKLRFAERKLQKALGAKQTDEARKLYLSLQSIVDRMARRNLLHSNTAARKKSRFSAKLVSLAGR